MVANVGKLSQVLEGALAEYNETNATMDLVLFEDAMKHVARIVRVIMNSGKMSWDGMNLLTLSRGTCSPCWRRWIGEAVIISISCLHMWLPCCPNRHIFYLWYL